MRQLMSHTAGFGYGLAGDDPANKAFRDERVLASEDLDEMMKKIAGIPLLYEPGTKWSYSVAVDIQGYLVQKLSGQKFGDYLKAHVTGPIGMTDTAFYVSPDRKSRFTEVYHWDRDAEQAGDERRRGPTAAASRIRRGSSRAAAASSARRTTTRGSARCCSTRARSAASASSSPKPSS